MQGRKNIKKTACVICNNFLVDVLVNTIPHHITPETMHSTYIAEE